MKTTKISLEPERQIITNLIVSDEFCKKILPIIVFKNMKSPYARTVGPWIKDYYDHYKESPKTLIQNIFAQRKGSIDDEQFDSIAEFLSSLSKAYDEVSDIHNIAYQVENAVTYLKIRSLELLKENIETAIASNNPVKAEAQVANYSRVGIPSGDSFSVLDDKAGIIEAFTKENEVVFSFLGAAKEVLAPVMRGDLCGYIGKPKGQKTTALLHTAEVAAMHGCRVLFFSLEMREEQIRRRIWQSLNACPIKDNIISMPYFEEIGENSFRVDTKMEHKKGIDLSTISSKQRSLKTMFNGGDIRFITTPRFSASIEDVIYHLDNLMYYENYIPDVLIIDYADILKPSTTVMKDEYRQRLNDIWMKLAALAQERNISVWTATQTNRSGLHGDIELESIAEEFRKIAHASMLIAINQNKAERDQNVLRLKALVKRDDAINNDDEVVVLQQLKIGRFYLDSKLSKYVERIEDH